MSRRNRGKRPWKQREKRRFRKSHPALSEHHLVPRSQGGEGGATILIRDDKHRAWHLLIRNNLPKEAAVILSALIPEEYRFFSFNKNSPISDIIDEINEWKKNPVKEGCLSNIVRLYPEHQERQQNETSNFPKLVLISP